MSVMNIGSEFDFEAVYDSLTLDSDQVLRFDARNPGVWGDKISVAIANPEDFKSSKKAFPGIDLDGLYEFYPDADNHEIGIVVKLGDSIKEVYLVSLDKDSKDNNNKSNFIENVINRQSNTIFVKFAGTVEDGVASCIDDEVVTLSGGVYDTVVEADLLTAYEVWENKEEVDIDIVIGNELDGGDAAFALADNRKDCMAFIGASYEIVGMKAARANAKVITERGDRNSMFACFAGNYALKYDRFSDKNRWMNIAGDIAGLRAQTSSSRATWWASAGLDRGQLKGVIKLAYNPNQQQRDALYKVNVNPIVTFPGQGTVCWGQKTLLSKPSSFDRINVRNLFNHLERALGKMAKYQVMEFNDNFTRNRIVSMIKPFLGTVQAGRGIQDFLIICDETNNTPDVISRNQLVVDVYIKPTYVAEFILLRFTNAGTNNFSEIVGG